MAHKAKNTIYGKYLPTQKLLIFKYLFIYLCLIVVAADGLSCPKTCEIFFLQPGIEPTSPELEGRFLTTGPIRKPQKLLVLQTCCKPGSQVLFRQTWVGI